MKNQFKFVFISALLVFGCNSASYDESWRPVAEELFKIECDQLKKSGIDMKDMELYDIHSAAFMNMMIKPERLLLARYEVLHQQLAHFEHQMNEKEHQLYLAEMKKIFSQPCND